VCVFPKLEMGKHGAQQILLGAKSVLEIIIAPLRLVKAVFSPCRSSSDISRNDEAQLLA
jgi:hypothetical protein